MPRTLRVQCPGAIYHVMDRGDRQEDVFINDLDRHDLVKTLAEACFKTDWQVHTCFLMRNHLMSRMKRDPGKLAMAARLRRETILPLKWIAARVQIGTMKGAKAFLHLWIHSQAKPVSKAPPCEHLRFQSTV